MKNIKLTVPSSSVDEMNDLVHAVCTIMGQDPTMMRDKFKMVDMAHPHKIMNLCEHLGLNVEFRNSKGKKDISIEIIGVPNDFTLDSLKPVSEGVEEKVLEKKGSILDRVTSNTPNIKEPEVEVLENKTTPTKEEEAVDIVSENNDSDDDDFPF